MMRIQNPDGSGFPKLHGSKRIRICNNPDKEEHEGSDELTWKRRRAAVERN
jgi:hypothetical protein